MTLTCSVKEQDPNPARLFEFVLPNEDNLQVPEEEQICQPPHARRRTRSAAIPLRNPAEKRKALLSPQPAVHRKHPPKIRIPTLGPGLMQVWTRKTRNRRLNVGAWELVSETSVQYLALL